MILITGFPGQDARILSLACGALGIKTYVMTHKEDKFTRDLGAHASNISDGKVKIIHSNKLFNFGIKKFLQQEHIRFVFHLAAISDPATCERTPIQAYDSNVGLTQELLRAVVDLQSDIRVGFASSIYVKSTEDCRNSSIEETTSDSSSCGVYVRTKKICSELIGIYRKGGLVKCSQFFLGNHESPIRKKNFIMPTLIKKIRDGDVGEEIRRPYVVRDWQDAFVTLAQIVIALKRSPGNDFVVGSGYSYSIADVANKLAEINNKPLIYRQPYDLNERDVVDINPAAIESATGICGSEESMWKLLIYLNQHWGKINDQGDMNWLNQSPGWNLLKEALLLLTSE